MFGLSILLILLVVALYILGPQRLPSAAEWLGQAVRRVRGFTATTQEQMRAELGPEFDELRNHCKTSLPCATSTSTP
jgi:sec-independent protein translocase protein TatB